MLPTSTCFCREIRKKYQHCMVVQNIRPRAVELSNFITCPQSKSTCPTKIYLPINWHFSYFLKKTYVVGTRQQWLNEALLMSEYPQHNFFEILEKFISHNLDTLISKSHEVLVPGQVNWNFLSSGEMGQVGHGISSALLYWTVLLFTGPFQLESKSQSVLWWVSGTVNNPGQ